VQRVSSEGKSESWCRSRRVGCLKRPFGADSNYATRRKHQRDWTKEEEGTKNGRANFIILLGKVR
jgi:hypothetical protein